MMDYTYEKAVCRHCGRKILVEMGLIGVPHHTWVHATCAACIPLPINETFRAQSPAAAVDLEQWLAQEEHG
ncbi:MAG: hypothetical protein L0191_03180 [Acidobacteria bacterium]|nr:hypothetical protein [Acidobacteriota bacterium]